MLLQYVQRGVIALEQFRRGLEAAVIGAAIDGVGFALLDRPDEVGKLPVGLFHPGNASMQERGRIERYEIVDQASTVPLGGFIRRRPRRNYRFRAR
jgi:hypothetical protein